MSNLLFIWVAMFLVWTALNAPLSAQKTIFGIILSFLIAVIANVYDKEQKKFKLKTFFCLIKYFVVFLKELVKANLNMARIVLTPSLPISPKIFKVTTSLKSPIARTLLANSITLTPGTISVELDGDTLYIHVVEGDKVENVEDLKGPFEKILREAFE
ncbi:cation antiporter [Thermoanaerobacter ethanolicus JW 200]|uniref:Na+/H+ antiporter subunit E n=1 Tax=Thermoanaerobacter ethanolicus TaxID=1757 RepID=UPI000202E9FD|nr:cation antiporter [Thermoanaerobacter ethanolicus JW 200]